MGSATRVAAPQSLLLIRLPLLLCPDSGQYYTHGCISLPLSRLSNLFVRYYVQCDSSNGPWIAECVLNAFCLANSGHSGTIARLLYSILSLTISPSGDLLSLSPQIRFDCGSL